MNIDKPLLIALILIQFIFTILVLYLNGKPRTAIHMSPCPNPETDSIHLSHDPFHHQAGSMDLRFMDERPMEPPKRERTQIPQAGSATSGFWLNFHRHGRMRW